METINISNDTLNFIREFASTAVTLGMEYAILSKDLSRARDESLSKFILDDQKTIPTDGFDYIVLSNLSLLVARLALMKDCTVQALVRPDDENQMAIRKLIFKSGRSTIEYCTMTASTLKSPRKVLDVFTHDITIDQDDISQLALAIRALPQHKDKEYVVISNDDTGVSFEVQDINKDKYNRILNATSDGPHFLYRYNSKVLLGVLRINKESCTIQVGDEQGYLKTHVNGFSLFILPTVEA